MTHFIRQMTTEEYPLLEIFLYEAIFQRSHEPKLPPSVINQPDLAVFIADFGRLHDYCLVAECNGELVGAVWIRILAGDTKGFGHVDDQTPEFALSVLPDHRGKGIGTALMKAMLDYVHDKAYPKVSLAVQKDNYAHRLYSKLGFVSCAETEEEYIMVYHTKKLEE